MSSYVHFKSPDIIKSTNSYLNQQYLGLIFLSNTYLQYFNSNVSLVYKSSILNYLDFSQALISKKKYFLLNHDFKT